MTSEQEQNNEREGNRPAGDTASGLSTLLRLLRLRQWVKNLLIFVPAVMAHKITFEALAVRNLTAFFCFGLAASATYILNDVLDREADRRHPEKKSRPLASGETRPFRALLIIPFLLAGAFALASTLNAAFLLLLLIYLATTTAYSFWLKRVMLADAVTLAMLYALRIFAGAVSVSVPVSSWLLTFAIFFFFSLALVKRYMEILSISPQQPIRLPGRGYKAQDLIPVQILGTASGLISVLVLALYISSEEITLLYEKPQILWLICPLILGWIGRLWLLAGRGLVTQDPIVFAFRDPASYVLGVLAGACLLGAA